jgi:hypothetical protein
MPRDGFETTTPMFRSPWTLQPLGSADITVERKLNRVERGNLVASILTFLILTAYF